MKLSRVLATLTLGLSLTAVAYAKDQIDHPMYKLWSDCKAGSWVQMHTVSDNAGNKSETTTTTKLLEITPEKATLENKTSMMMNGKPFDMPAQKQEYPAKMDKPDAAPAANAEKPTEGDEEIEVGGKKLKCHWTLSKSDTNGMKIESKSYMSDEIPGHVAKTETKMDGTVKGTSSSTAVKWEKK